MVLLLFGLVFYAGGVFVVYVVWFVIFVVC